MAKITYQNKEEAPDRNNPAENEVFWPGDANEIKESVNELYDTIDSIIDPATEKIQEKLLTWDVLPNNNPITPAWAGSVDDLNLVKKYIGTDVFYPSSARFVSNSGNDSLDGLTPATAWKTIAKVNALTRTPGMSILFERCGVWREQLTANGSGVAGNPITYGSYGNGLFPIISGANLITGFTSVSGSYDAALTSQPNCVIVGGMRGIYKASKAACTNFGDWFWAANVLTVNWMGDPSGIVEAGARASSIAGSGGYNAFQNLILTGANTYGVYQTGANNVFRNSVYIRIGGRGQNGFGCAVGAANTITEDCVFSDIERNGIANNGSPNLGTIIRRCTFISCGNKLPYQGGGSGVGVSTTGAEEWDISYNHFYRCFQSVDIGGGASINVHHNISFKALVNGFCQNLVGVSGKPNYILNNTVIHEPTQSAGHGIVTQTGGSEDVIVKNNIVYITYTGTNAGNINGLCLDSASSSTVEVDNNLVYKIPGSTADLYKLGSTIYNSLASWKAALAATPFTDKGEDEMSSDPLFTDFNNRDYTLQSTSPARGAANDGSNIGAL